MDTKTYLERRDHLRKALGGEPALILGNRLAPRNYRDNFYPFRQSSHVLYYSGARNPDTIVLIGREPKDDVLCGPKTGIDDVVWYGPHQSIEDYAKAAGILRVLDPDGLASLLDSHFERKAPLHYVPPFSSEQLLWLTELLRKPPRAVLKRASTRLARAIVAQRERKTAAEIHEIEDALRVTAAMHRAAMRATKPGRTEAEVMAAAVKVAMEEDRSQAYTPIVTVRGEVLHNTTYHHRLEAGQFLLNDSGSESALGYASDITRTYPVTGKMTEQQRGIYETVLRAQLAGIAAIRPGVRYREVHLLAARTLATGLRDLGLLKGSVSDAVQAGAHALFYPHGLGHLLGLDVHDMEDLGDLVGYPEGEPRSTVFGLNYLRLSKELPEGAVLTVEPGIYFIPALIARWKEERRHLEFIDYACAERFSSIGGVRIEDDVLVTKEGCRVLGPRIEKEPDALCALVGS